MKDIITIRGERQLWLDFIHRARRDKKRVWDILGLYLRKYTSSDQNTRVLLVLFPRDLVDQLLAKDDPDGFVKEAIRLQLSKDA